MIWLFVAVIGFVALSTLLMNKTETASSADDKQAYAIFALVSLFGAGLSTATLVVWVLTKVAPL